MSDYKQVIVMRTDLNMRKGKMVAQGAHASVGALLSGSVLLHGQVHLTHATEKWMAEGHTKVCVGVASLEELERVYGHAQEIGLTAHRVVDSGRTEFAGEPTVTCVAIGPGPSAQIDLVTGNLKLL